jgi:hypothetical protein
VIRTAAWGFDFVDTVLELHQPTDGGGSTLIDTSDDEDPASGQFYSRIDALSLVPGQSYCLRVTGKLGNQFGLYAVIVTAN